MKAVKHTVFGEKQSKIPPSVKLEKGANSLFIVLQLLLQ